MSEENVETFRRVVAGFNRGGDPQGEELFDPEVRIEPLLAGGVEGVVYRGRAGAVEFVSQLNEIFAEVHSDYSRIEEFDDVLLVSGKTTGRGRTGGVPVEQPWFWISPSGRHPTALTHDHAGKDFFAASFRPTWAPNGKRIVFSHADFKGRSGTEGLYTMRPDGTHQKRVTHMSPKRFATNPDWGTAP